LCFDFSLNTTPHSQKSINHNTLISPPQVQIHGPVSLSENVECIVVNPRHKRDLLTTKLLDRFVKQNKCNLIWMDPDDLIGAMSSSLGATGHYPSASTLLGPSPRTRSDKPRPSYLSKTKPSFRGESKSKTDYSELIRKPKRSFTSESRYRTLSEPKPGFLNKSKPKVLSEIRPRTSYSASKPKILSETKLRTLSDSKPRTLSRPCYSYRDPDRIRPRTTATAGRRDRRSSLRGPSRKKDSYF